MAGGERRPDRSHCVRTKSKGNRKKLQDKRKTKMGQAERHMTVTLALTHTLRHALERGWERRKKCMQVPHDAPGHTAPAGSSGQTALDTGDPNDAQPNLCRLNIHVIYSSPKRKE